jgi:hypothetical protein
MTYYADDLNEFHIVLDILWNYNKYNYVYISIGGKINCSEVNIRQSDNTIILKSNAHLQMRPSFVCDRDDSSILLICVDHFQSESDEKLNRDICKNIIQSNMDFMFYNHCITPESITEFIQSFNPILEARMILPENFIFCNYIRFANTPNASEALLDDNLSEILYNAISPQYKKSLFQWFGYHPNLYNIIFNYEEYYLTYLSRFGEVIHFFKEKYHESQISTYFACDLNNEIPKFPFLEKFMKSTIDINSYCSGDKLADRFIEYI